MDEFPGSVPEAVESFGADWIELLEPFRGEFETPARSLPRQLDLS